jgi:hypothetical protein
VGVANLEPDNAKLRNPSPMVLVPVGEPPLLAGGVVKEKRKLGDWQSRCGVPALQVPSYRTPGWMTMGMHHQLMINTAGSSALLSP